MNWGDGQIQELGAITGSSVVFHTYQSPGSYVINATVVDSFGTSVPVSSSVVVNPKPQPTVTLTGPTGTPTAGTDTRLHRLGRGCHRHRLCDYERRHELR